VILITPEEFGADRETVELALEPEDIEARPMWKPMHLQPVFRSADYPSTISRTYPSTIFRSYRAGGAGADYEDSKHKKTYPCRVVGGKVAEDLFNRGLCMPSGTAMTEEDLNRVISVILGCKR